MNGPATTTNLLMRRTFYALWLLALLAACTTAPTAPTTDYLLLTEDEAGYGYRDGAGNTVVPTGKYAHIFTDTFRQHAMVVTQEGAIVLIDRQEQVLYEVYKYDNGPDYPAEGLFRIVQNGKIGFADAESYAVVIAPQFDCAFPFEEGGRARVSNACTTVQEGDYSIWESEAWQRIDKTGKIVPE